MRVSAIDALLVFGLQQPSCYCAVAILREDFGSAACGSITILLLQAGPLKPSRRKRETDSFIYLH